MAAVVVSYEESDCYPRLYCDSEWQGQMKQIWNYGNTCTQHGRHFVLHFGTFVIFCAAGGVFSCILYAVINPIVKNQEQRRKQALSAAKEEERVLQEQEEQRRKQTLSAAKEEERVLQEQEEQRRKQKQGTATSRQISIEMTPDLPERPKWLSHLEVTL